MPQMGTLSVSLAITFVLALTTTSPVTASTLTHTELVHVSEAAAVFTDASLALSDTASTTPTFSFASWLNDPVLVATYKASSPAQAMWTVTAANASSVFATTMARHLDATGVGPVDVVTAESGELAPPHSTCTFSGWVSTHASSHPKPVWTVTLTDCYMDLTSADDTCVELSQDGGTLVASVITGGPNVTEMQAVFLALDGQTGEMLFRATPPAGFPQTPQGTSVSTSRAGVHSSFVNGATVFVFNRTGALVTDPIDMGYHSFARICPMGVFLTYGVLDAHVRMWNGTDFPLKYVFPGDGTWQVEDSAISVNGGLSLFPGEGLPPVIPSRPLDNVRGINGCLVAFSWINVPTNGRQARVTVNSMLYGRQYIDWQSSINNSTQTLAAVSFDMQFLAVATWGNAQATAPTLLLFDVLQETSKPIWTYTTPGSMFSVDLGVLYDGSDANSAYIVAAGKHVPASDMGSGGDAYAFLVNFQPSP